MNVLGIETSCDETAVAVVGPDGVASDIIHSQAIHTEYGGVVPELASRAHAERVVVSVRAALDKAGIERPDAIAATAGPGLVGAVLVGLSHARALSAGWGVPFVAVNHLEAHLLSPLLDDPAPAFPFLSLVVSGGHTTLYLARGVGDYTVVAQTIDDAAGEAYDKVARMLGLGYPGGPPIDRLAAQGNPKAVAFPRPRVKELRKSKRRGQVIERSPLDMSFSGLKTAVRNHVHKPGRASTEDVAASFQAALVDVLLHRIRKASEKTGVRRVAIGGGVAANSELRTRLAQLPGITAFIPPRARCTDNGAMIAHCGRLRLLAGQRDSLDVTARSGWVPGDP